MKTLTKILGVGGLVAALGAGFALGREYPKGPATSAEIDDVNNDGIQDVYVFLGNDQNGYVNDFVMLGMKDGSYQKAKISVTDGYPFYKTEEGTYNPWGGFMSFEEQRRWEQEFGRVGGQ